LNLAGNSAFVLAPGASLKLYVYADKASFGSGSFNMTPGSRATNLRYYGMPSNTSLDFHGNVNFLGVIYAPDAALAYSGGGSGLNLMGASMSKSVKMDGSFNFHYDEALRNGAVPGYVVTKWDEL
jgi:hypothetical protein